MAWQPADCCDQVILDSLVVGPEPETWCSKYCIEKVVLGKIIGAMNVDLNDKDFISIIKPKTVYKQG
jgi:hypothetical protein